MAMTSTRRSRTGRPTSRRVWTRLPSTENIAGGARVSVTTTSADERAPETEEQARRRAPGSTARRPLTGLLFVAPTAVIVAGLFLVPLAILVYMSFMDWPLLGSPTPDGFDNYRHIADDSQF